MHDRPREVQLSPPDPRDAEGETRHSISKARILLDEMSVYLRSGAHVGSFAAVEGRVRLRLRGLSSIQAHSMEADMTTLTLSADFGVVIPEGIRERLHLAPGQKMQAIAYDDRIELVPLRPLSELRGFLRGIDTEVEREPDRL